MKLGTLTIPSTAALAPMAGVGDAAFRRICKQFGAAYLVGEMASSTIPTGRQRSCWGSAMRSGRSRSNYLGTTRPSWPRPPAGRWNLAQM